MAIETRQAAMVDFPALKSSNPSRIIFSPGRPAINSFGVITIRRMEKEERSKDLRHCFWISGCASRSWMIYFFQNSIADSDGFAKFIDERTKGNRVGLDV